MFLGTSGLPQWQHQGSCGDPVAPHLHCRFAGLPATSPLAELDTTLNAGQARHGLQGQLSSCGAGSDG